ncbi:hypothetical protein HYPDE_25938 [Hyphomicrobium denitrificans 1NES1]|uniref:Uncharacterized protein n=1 Tax=Hyphomicrobium denitrificans 1NES1 TaxID=670307 RepID=N0B9T5_9HYPH|nr:hypothetical protein HYPDE_25938 [Hyphomicrobium denitrificans 1NES1]
MARSPEGAGRSWSTTLGGSPLSGMSRALRHRAVNLPEKSMRAMPIEAELNWATMRSAQSS